MNRKELAEMLRRRLSMTGGDDLERARIAFRGLSPTEMDEQHGQSGRTRQEVLDGYIEHRRKEGLLKEFVEELLARDSREGAE